MRNRTICYFLVCLLLLPAISVQANGEDDPYLGAMDLTAVVDSVNETVTLSWRNIDTVNYQLLDALKTTNYTVLRSDEPITMANYLQAESIAENLQACFDTDAGGVCKAKPHSYVYTIPPGTDGRYYYGIVSLMSNGTIGDNLSVGNATLAEPTTEYGTPTSAPHDVRAAYNATASTTEIEWIDFSRIDGLFGANHTTSVWSHALPAHRENWENLSKVELAGNLTPEQESMTVHHPTGTDQDRYYTVLHTKNNQTDARLLSGNTLTEAVEEDNVGSILNGTLQLQFNATAGVTSLNWSGAAVEDVNHTLHIWRSTSVIISLDAANTEHVATLTSSATHYNHSINSGVSGEFHYAVTLTDQLMNQQTRLDLAPSGSVTETTLAPAENIVSTLAASYANSVTTVSWTDLFEHPEATYSIWRSTDGAITSLTNSGVALIGVVNASVETFEYTVLAGTSQDAWYAVTASASFGTPGLNAPQTTLSPTHNTLSAPVTEDALTPSAPALVSAIYLNNGTVKIAWNGMANEDGTVWNIYRVSAENTEEQSQWVLVDSIENMGSMMHNIYLASSANEGHNEQNVYALSGVDVSGNEINFGDWTLSSTVEEDREKPTIHLQLLDVNGISASSRWFTGGEVSTFSNLEAGAYTLHITSSETLESMGASRNTGAITDDLSVGMAGLQGQTTLALSSDIENITYVFTALDLSGNSITFSAVFCTSCLIENTQPETNTTNDEIDEAEDDGTDAVIVPASEGAEDLNMMLIGLSSVLGLLVIALFMARKEEVVSSKPTLPSGVPTVEEDKWTERYIRE